MEWMFSFAITLVVAVFMRCMDISLASCMASLKQLLVISLCCYVAVLPVIVVSARKPDKFLSGVVFSFFYGFCGIFLANGNFINLYPMTMGLVLSNYAHEEKITYTPSLSIVVLLVLLFGSLLLLKMFHQKHNEI